VIKAKVDLSNAKKLPFSIKKLVKKQKKSLGEKMVQWIKDTIRIGQSPVRGVGRFIGYKNPLKYPGNLKPKSPVNLKKSGAMLKAMKSRVINDEISVGIWDEKQSEILTYIEMGVNMAGPRPVLPSKNEQFNVSIQRKLQSAFLNLVKNAVKKLR
jgi:hypothetical protein